MKNLHSNALSVNDFNDICRVCLNKKGDMVDIFATGMYRRIIEVTNVEISSSDKLANKMCHDCSLQLENFYKFQCQVKDSDNYLRALMLAEESFNNESVELNSEMFKEGNSQNGKALKNGIMENRNVKSYASGVLRKNQGSDKMYLIVVTDPSNNSESKNEICIKDLDQENENVELADFCRAVVQEKSSSHFHKSNKCVQLSPVECRDMVENKEKKSGHNVDFITAVLDFIKSESKLNVYKVNLNIYNCNHCKKSFESVDNLKDHLEKFHKVSSSSISFLDLKYICTVCYICESDKNIFLKHLIDHKRQGFSFIKVNAIGDYVPLSEFEKEIFEIPTPIGMPKFKCRIFKISIDCYKCVLCKKLIESDESIVHHFKVCHQKLKKGVFSSHVRYTCPACFESWLDDAENFYRHLLSHKKDHIFFIKVDSLGQEIDLSQSDSMFTPFVKALEMLEFDSEIREGCSRSIKGTRVVKMQDIRYCDVCNYEAKSGSSLSLHYSKIHNEILTVKNICCPVCFEEFGPSETDENVKFYDHLMKHKESGICFLKIKRDGTVMHEDSNSSELFSNVSDFFTGKIDCPELELIADFFAPEILIENILYEENKYFCDLCDKSFPKKKGVFDHLKKHMKEGSKAQKEYVCEKCGCQILGAGNYKRHFISHRMKCDTSGTQKRPICSICSKTFSNRAALNEHRRHHLNEGIKHGDSVTDSLDKNCEICGRKFASNSSLAKHKKLHSGDKENTFLKCKICERDFRKESVLKKHISAHLNPNCFECDICKLPLLSLASLKHHKLCHQSNSNTFDCKVCRVSFLTEERLIAHQAHTGHHQDRKRFECNVCHEKFFVGRRFMQHIKMHPKYKMGECSVCGKRLATMQSLMLHLSRHFKSNSILCPHCGKHFYEERNYHRHLLTHVGLKPFRCDIKDCTKAFYTFFELNRHKKYHNNTRNFNCSYCPKSFHEANHLKVHIRTHTGEKPYICPHCKRGFVTRTRCKQHINLIHQGIGCDLIQSNISKVVEVFEAAGS